MSQQDKKSEPVTLTWLFGLVGGAIGTAFAVADQGFAAGEQLGRHLQNAKDGLSRKA